MAHTPWSRLFGPIYTLDDMIPSERAVILGQELEKDPKQIEIILQESDEVVKYGRKVLVTQNKAGIVCANGGIDQSNAGIGKLVAVPHHTDEVATKISEYIYSVSGKRVAVILSDTVGRALRRGAVNIGIGVHGINAMESEIGKKDLFGYTMRVSEVAIIDELASAAELVMGQTTEANPFVVIRGFEFDWTTDTNAKILNRPADERIFK